MLKEYPPNRQTDTHTQYCYRCCRYVLPRGLQRMATLRAFPPVLSRAFFDPDNLNEIVVEWLPPVNLLDTAGSALPTDSGLQFMVQRDPAFPSGDVMVNGDQYTLTDTDVTEPLTSYSYRVVAVKNGEAGGRTAFNAAVNVNTISAGAAA